MFSLVLTCFFFAAGLAGTIVPVFPGTLLIWLGMLIYGLGNGFSSPGWSFYLGQTLALALLETGAAGNRCRQRYGSSGYATCGGILGALAGALSLGPAGIFFGSPMGAVTGELLAGRPPARALALALGTLAGLTGNRVMKLFMELALITWFLVSIKQP